MTERMSAFAGPRALAPLFSVLAVAACSHVAPAGGDGGVGPGTDAETETETGSETESPPPCSPDFHAIYGVSDDDVYAVGSCGFALRFDGDAWQPLDFDAAIDFEDVWGSGPSDVFFAGAQRTELPEVAQEECGDLWDSSDGCYASSAVVYHFDGAAWELALERPKNTWFRAIGGSGAQVVAGGGKYDVGGEFWRFDGASWSGLDALSYVVTTEAIWIIGSRMWVAYNGIMDLDGYTRCYVDWFDAAASGQVCPDDHLDCSDLWMDEGGRFIAVGDDLIVFYDGASCAFEALPEGNGGLNAVWGRSLDDVWAVGDLGAVLHRSGGVWSEIPVPGELDDVWFVDVWASADAVYVVGNYYIGADEVEWVPVIVAYRDGAWSVEYE